MIHKMNVEQLEEKMKLLENNLEEFKLVILLNWGEPHINGVSSRNHCIPMVRHTYVTLIVSAMISSYTHLRKYNVVLQLDTVIRSLSIATHDCHCGKQLY